MLAQIARWCKQVLARCEGQANAPRVSGAPPFHLLAQPGYPVPPQVAACQVTRRYLELLGRLDWAHFPEPYSDRPRSGRRPLPRAVFVRALLIKIEEGLPHMSDLRRFLHEHPSLAWAIGFPLSAQGHPQLPCARHFSRVLRTLDNAALQFLLTSSLRLIQAEAPPEAEFGQVVALDTKHILAWVKENNPKQHLRDRYLKQRQPPGDPDCRLGCKVRHNRPDPATPTTHPRPASHLSVGQFYWGYASGVVATRLPDASEVVLAEYTQPFDQHDTTYFYPLMAQVEQRLGRRPRFGALDAAYDTFYVHDYFHQAGGFAAVPLASRGGHKQRHFTPDGTPLCPADLPMTLRYTFLKRSSPLPHPCQRYGCPLRFPQPSGQDCPIHHPSAAKQGCSATLAASPGSRLRYQLDRSSPDYQAVYAQRTAAERINAQAVALGIERPRLRNRRSITNLNTLIYLLINLHAWRRLRSRCLAAQEVLPMPAT